MTLRLLSGAGVSLSFVIVASCFLALLLLGWRAGLQLIQHARAKPSADTERKPDHHAIPQNAAPRSLSYDRAQRYWPVLDTVSMDRPGWVPCLEEMSVRMKTIRSPFFPEIFAQSSGLVVLGRSSFSANSSKQACIR